MAMLAEVRRKQKWTLNPRGKHWSDDSNKFGQKMLEKMGWTSGKGLGVNEQGMKEHVKISFKNDTAGIGFKTDKLDCAWSEQQEGFNEFLQQLQNNNDLAKEENANPLRELGDKSLELKSKRSRARVHYHKFTRGKDVHKYSSRDLANIFGQKDLSVKDLSKNEEHDNTYVDPIGTKDVMGGVITVKGGSMTEYFKQKNYCPPSKCKSNQDYEEGSVDDENNERAGFGFTSGMNRQVIAGAQELKASNHRSKFVYDNPCLDLNNVIETCSSTEKSKTKFVYENAAFDGNNSELNSSKKKRKKSKDRRCYVNSGLNLDSNASEGCNGNEFEVSRMQYGFLNSGLDLVDELHGKSNDTVDDYLLHNTEADRETIEQSTFNLYEVKVSKDRKKRKRLNNEAACDSFGISNAALDDDIITDKIKDSDVSEKKGSKAKRRREQRMSTLETIVEVIEEDRELNGCTTTNKITSVHDDASKIINGRTSICKRKLTTLKVQVECEDKMADIDIESKEKLKNPKDIVALVNIQEGTDEYIRIVSKKKKKKEKKRRGTDDNHDSNINLDPEQHINNMYEQDIVKCQEEVIVTTHKMRKSKRHKELDESATAIVESKGINTSDDGASTENNGKAKISDKENGKKCKSRIQDEIENEAAKYKAVRKENEGIYEEVKIGDVYIKNNVTVQEAETKDTMHVTTFSRTIKTEHENLPNREIVHSYWDRNTRVSKKLLKTFFHRNSVSDFPGSNIRVIKGYGTDMQGNNASI